MSRRLVYGCALFLLFYLLLMGAIGTFAWLESRINYGGEVTLSRLTVYCITRNPSRECAAWAEETLNLHRDVVITCHRRELEEDGLFDNCMIAAGITPS